MEEKIDHIISIITKDGWKEYTNHFSQDKRSFQKRFIVEPTCLTNEKFFINIHLHQDIHPHHPSSNRYLFSVGFTMETQKNGWANCQIYNISVDSFLEKLDSIIDSLIKGWQGLNS